MNIIEGVRRIKDNVRSVINGNERAKISETYLINPGDRLEVTGFIIPSLQPDNTIDFTIVESRFTPWSQPRKADSVVSSSVIMRVPSGSDEDLYGVPAGSGFLMSGNLIGGFNELDGWKAGLINSRKIAGGRVSRHETTYGEFVAYLRPDESDQIRLNIISLKDEKKIPKNYQEQRNRLVVGMRNETRETEWKSESLSAGRAKLCKGEMPARLKSSFQRAYTALAQAGYFENEMFAKMLANAIDYLKRTDSYSKLIDKYGSGLWDEMGMMVGYLAHRYGFSDYAIRDGLTNRNPIFIRDEGDRWFVQYEYMDNPDEMLAAIKDQVREETYEGISKWVEEAKEESGCSLRAVWNKPKKNGEVYISLVCGGADYTKISGMMGNAPVSPAGEVIIAMYPFTYNFRGRDRQLSPRGCIYDGCGKCRTDDGNTMILPRAASMFLTN